MYAKIIHKSTYVVQGQNEKIHKEIIYNSNDKDTKENKQKHQESAVGSKSNHSGKENQNEERRPMTLSVHRRSL